MNQKQVESSCKSVFKSETESDLKFQFLERWIALVNQLERAKGALNSHFK